MPELIDWYCPQCSEKNYDLPDQGTHCGYCGRAVWVGNEDHQIWDEGWNVEMPANNASTRTSGDAPASEKVDPL